jgi:hypothetical protein
MDFSKLKKSSGLSSIEKLNQEIAKYDNNSGAKDERFWYPAVDKAGNGFAVGRFLPPPGNEDVPFVRVFSHGFKGPMGQWYIENSLTTIGQNDPVSEYNSQLWNTGLETNKEIVRKQKRKLAFISNFYVITDTLNPENQGKVFLFRYGKKIFDKLNEAMNPPFPDKDPMNPFDLWTGANFKIKIRQVEGYRNYDMSEFAEAGPLFDDDAKLEAIWKQELSLQEFVDPNNQKEFKTYAELKAKLHRVLCLDQVASPRAAEVPTSTPRPAAARQAPELPSVEEDSPPWVGSAADDDADLSFFKKMAE